MFKYWLKNRSWISFLVILCLSILVGLIFIRLQIQTEASNRTRISVYTDSEISYDIPSPSKEQLEQIAQEDFVDAVFGYYYTETELTYKGKSLPTTILLSDYMNNVDFTMYSNKRCIEKAKETLDNPIYIDYEYAKKYGIKLKDKLLFHNIVFDVQAIFETNTYYGSAVLIPLIGEQKALIDSQNVSYSGAFIKVNDIKKAQDYWQTYKPYGRLKSPAEFSTIEAYNYHYDEWNSQNYLNEITDFSKKEQNVLLETYPSNYIWSITFVALAIVFDIILSLRNSEKRFFKKKEFSKDVRLYYLLTTFWETIVACATLLIIPIIIKGFTAIYVSDLLLKQVYIQVGITVIVYFVFNFSWGAFSSRIKK